MLPRRRRAGASGQGGQATWEHGMALECEPDGREGGRVKVPGPGTECRGMYISASEDMPQ